MRLDERCEPLLGYFPNELRDYFNAGFLWRVKEDLKSMYTEDEADRWISSPHELLGGKSAREAVRDGEYEKVSEILDELLSGVFL